MLEVCSDLHSRQLKLEEESIGLGVARYHAEREDKGEDQSLPGQRLVKDKIAAVTAGIKAWIASHETGRAREYTTITRFLKGIPAEVLAYLTCKICVQATTKNLSVTSASLGLAHMILDELNLRAFAQADRRLYNKTKTDINKSSSPRYKRAAVKARMRNIGVSPDSWSAELRLKLGRHLIDIFITETNVLQYYTEYGYDQRGRITTTKLTGTPETLAWLKEQHEYAEALRPVYQPMLTTPKPWTNPFNGGYLSLKMKMIKSPERKYLEELRHYEMPVVYQAINSLQGTPWTINSQVLEVAQEVWLSGGTLGGLPAQEDALLPPKPLDIDDNPESLKAWKRVAAEVYGSNARLTSKRLSVGVTLQLARKFAGETIYFPYTMDWRGRVYPVPPILNPQVGDLGKALLMFSEGKALGERGLWWLKIHTANLFGIDKVTMEERVAWVDEHMDDLIESAENPLDGRRFWTTASKKPYQALAACFELLNASHFGVTAVSHIPIAMDGSCNGIQNFSAMLRDEEGGAAVNLVPQDKPQDIYARVAAVVAAKVAQDAQDGVRNSPVWVGNVTRSIVKRPVMTLPYGATQYGMRGQIHEELKKEQAEGTCQVVGDFYWAAKYLAQVVYQSIGEVVKAARQVMDWLQEASRVAAADDIPIHWVTPAGLPVLQAYRKQRGKRVECYVDGRRLQISLLVASKEIDHQRQAQGIAPNFVHSMDASHLMLTVNTAVDRGVTCFAMVHDSYATHASDSDLLAATWVAAHAYRVHYTASAEI